MFRKKKGQAAVTDALFFLMIIVTLAVLMFRYSSSYGDRVDQSISDLYFKEYANAAMRTIFYSSIPLNYDLNYQSGQEVDYLMTAVKHDYYPDKLIGKNPDINQMRIADAAGNPDYDDIVKFNLYHMVKSIMRPLNNYDYVFYIYDADEKYIFFLLKLTNYEDVTDQTSNLAKYRKIYSIDSDNPYSYYLCNPQDYTIVRSIISKANKIYSSSIPMRFQYYTPETTLTDVAVNTTFAIWPATVDISSNPISNDFSDIEKLRCKLISENLN